MKSRIRCSNNNSNRWKEIFYIVEKIKKYNPWEEFADIFPFVIKLENPKYQLYFSFL